MGAWDNMKHKILAITLIVVTIVLFVVWAIVPSIVGLPPTGGRIDDSEVTNGTALQRGAAIASWLGFPLMVFAGMGAWDQSMKGFRGKASVFTQRDEG